MKKILVLNFMAIFAATLLAGCSRGDEAVLTTPEEGEDVLEMSLTTPEPLEGDDSAAAAGPSEEGESVLEGSGEEQHDAGATGLAALAARLADTSDEDLQSAHENPDPQSTHMTRERKANILKSLEKFEERKKTCGDNPEYFVAFGLMADKAARRIELDAYTTGVGPSDIAEFYIITANSGHGYEALLVAMSTADDICKAVEFIGVPRGTGVNYKELRYWPKGERVMATVSIDGAVPAPLDSMVRFTDTGEPLSNSGFVYVGDRRDDGDAFIGDSSGPGSIISTYNEPITVFDVPRKAPQSEVYEHYTISTNVVKIQDAWADVVLYPESRPEGAPPRIRDVRLSFSTNGVSLNGASPAPFAEVLGALRADSDSGRDIHAELSWGGDMPMGGIAETCRLLSLLDVEGGICIGPPVEGQPYYKAFMPNEQWRERSNRYMQPCELRFAADGSATLVAIEEIWGDDQLKPELKVEEIAGVTPETLPGLLQEKSPKGLPSVFVFAPASLEYGKIGVFIRALPEEFFDIHVFAVNN